MFRDTYTQQYYQNEYSPTQNFSSSNSSHEQPHEGQFERQIQNQHWESDGPKRSRPKTFNCAVCCRWFTSSGHLQRHYRTNLHKNALRSSDQPDSGTLSRTYYHSNRESTTRRKRSSVNIMENSRDATLLPELHQQPPSPNQMQPAPNIPQRTSIHLSFVHGTSLGHVTVDLGYSNPSYRSPPNKESGLSTVNTSTGFDIAAPMMPLENNPFQMNPQQCTQPVTNDIVTGTIRTEFQLSSTTSRPKLSTASNWYESGKLQIPFYSIIFTLAMIGNTLVIITLLRNHQMRTITNIFLLNLAVSDLLLGVLCMPFTLIGALLRDFVFGELMCKLLPFLQACSVAVGVWTLVAISVERYYAICHPLRSLRWQTLKHAYKLITAIWIGSFICMFPIALLSQLKPTKQGNHKCRETWQSKTQEKAYNIFLDVILLLLPLLIMLVTYSLISKTLFQAMRNERMQRDYCDGQDIRTRRRKSKKSKTEHRLTSTLPASNCSQVQLFSSTLSSRSRVGSMKALTLRRTNAEKSLVSKKRVVRMLFVVVLEFFICWAPLYVINTIALFDSSVIYNNLGYTAISFFQLLAYTSSCCNPITYCFMNRSFRKSFLNLFGCLTEYRNEFGTLGSEINMDSRFRSFRNHTYSANSV